MSNSTFTKGVGGSPLTTKGDTYVRGTQDDRLPVGTNGQVLTADSGESLGVKWGSAGAGDVVGPSSATDDNLATFDTTTGKLIQDGGSSVADVQARANHTGVQAGSTVEVEEIGTATYDDVQDWLNTTQSAGKITGGGFTDNGDGTVAVASGTGFIKTTDSDVGVTKNFNWSANSALSLTDNSDNYVYIDYNAGTPQVAVATTMPTDHNTKVLLGIIFREGTTLHIPDEMGQVIANSFQKIFFKDVSINGKFQRASGMIISEKTGRKIAADAGVFYAGITKNTTSAFDSSGADTFTEFYDDGSSSWTKNTGVTVIDNTHYDDGSGTLATLDDGGWGGEDSYGVRWVYMDVDGHIAVRIGTCNCTLAEAQDAKAPSATLPVMNSLGGVIGKIIIQKSATTFTSIQSSFDNNFAATGVVDHNDTANKQGGTAGEYYHLTSAEATVVGNTSGTNTGDDPGLENVVEDTTPQLGGELDAQAHSIGFTLQTATGDGTTTIDFKNGNKFKFTFGAMNETFTFTAPSKPCSLQIILVQDGTGGRTATFPASVKWAGGSAPTLSTGASAVDIVSMIYDGTSYFATSSLNFS